MSTQSIIITLAILAIIAYPYYAWWSYQRQCINFRSKLQIGARVKFLHNKEPRFGRVTRIFGGNAISVKDQETGTLFFMSRNKVYPRLGAENKNPLKSTKKQNVSGENCKEA